MSRPKTVNINSFHLYDKLHTRKTKMYSGVEMTILYPIKETAFYYMSIEVWAYCASLFKHKKEGFELSLDIPVITDEKTIEFLNKRAWVNHVEKYKDKPDIKETIGMLDKLFPNHKKIFFYELDSILSAYNHGTFISYDRDGNIEEPCQNDIETRKHYTQKYNSYGDCLNCSV